MQFTELVNVVYQVVLPLEGQSFGVTRRSRQRGQLCSHVHGQTDVWTCTGEGSYQLCNSSLQITMKAQTGISLLGKF